MPSLDDSGAPVPTPIPPLPGAKLRVLVIGGTEDDALVVVRALESAGYEVAWERVWTADPTRAALADKTWDVVLFYHRMPGLDAPTALRVMREVGLDLPFIIVSDTVGEEAVELLRAGAHDFLLRANLAQLAPAVERERQAALVRREQRESFAALRRQEARFRALTENAMDAVNVIDADGIIRYVSASATRLTGYAREDSVGHRLFDRVHPDDAAAAAAALSRVLANPAEAVRLASRYRRADGTWCVLESTGSNQLANPDIQGVVINWRDITERKAAEQAFHGREAELREAQRVARLGNWWLDSATDQVVWSEELYRMLGLDPKFPPPPYTEHHRLFTPESWKRLSTALPETQRTGIPYELELEMVRADGTTGWMLARGEQVRTENGVVVGVRGIAQDITARKRHTEALRLKNLVFDLSIAANSIADPSGTITQANDAFLRIWGYDSKNEVIGRPIRSFLAHAEVAAAIIQALDERDIWEGDYTATRKDGTTFDAHGLATVIRDERGDLIGYQSSVLDVTERKAAEEALAFRNAILSTQQDASPDGILVVDAQWEVVSFNRRFAEVWGIPAGIGLTAMNQRGLRSVLDQLADPDDYLARLEYLHEHPLEKTKTELALRDGRTLERCSAPMLGADGRCRGRVYYFRDITEHKNAERALKEQEAYFRSLIENGTDLIAILDADGVITYVSPSVERALGYAPADLLGRIAIELVLDEDRDAVRSTFERAGRAGTLARVQYRFQHRDGSWRHLESEVTNLLVDPTVAGMVVNSRDVTDRDQLQEQYLQSQKMEAIGRLAGGVAHDFNNLLTVIKANAEFLLEELAPPDSRREDVEQIRDAADRAAALTRQLLAFSRRQSLKPTDVDVNAVLADLQKLLRRLIGEDVALLVEPCDCAGTVHVDRQQLEQVIINLCVNARESMPDGGTLRVRARCRELDAAQAAKYPPLRPGPHVEIAVHDTGGGMAPEVVARVFEPFFTTKAQGTGLGLATVFGIVNQSDGTIAVESEPGHGSVFRVLLPRLPESVSVSRGVATAPPPSGTETVLLAEDEKAVRDAGLRALRGAGYTVLEARDGEEALRMFEEARVPVDVLVTDVVMPRLGGRELAKRLLELRPALKVLFVSGYTSDPLLHRGLTEGTRLLEKPFAPADLVRAVREVLDASRADAAASPPGPEPR